MAMIMLCDCDIDSLTYDRSDTKKDTPFQEVIGISFASSVTVFFTKSPVDIPLRMTGCLLPLRTLITPMLAPTALPLLEDQLLPCHLNQLLPHRVFNHSKPQLTLSSMASQGTHLYTLLSRMGNNLTLGSACSTMALAHAQDVAEILDPSYVPITQDDKDLF